MSIPPPPVQPPADQPSRRLSGAMWASIVVTALLLVGAGILIAVLLNGQDDASGEAAQSPAAESTETPSADETSPSGEATEPEGTSGEVVAPATAREDFGIPIGQDGVAGTVTEGAVEVAVYLDYMCPICRTFEEMNGETLDALREEGTITLVLHPISILDRFSQGTAYSTRSAAAAAWVADQAPEQLKDFNDAMFADQPEEQSEGLTDAEIQAVAEDAGVPAEVAAGIGDGTAASTFSPWATAATTFATADAAGPGVQGTPTVTIDGQFFDGNWTTDGELEAAIRAAAG